MPGEVDIPEQFMAGMEIDLPDASAARWIRRGAVEVLTEKAPEPPLEPLPKLKPIQDTPNPFKRPRGRPRKKETKT